MKQILALLIVFSTLILNALPLWIRPDEKSGAFHVEQIPFSLLHFNRNWIGQPQNPKLVKGRAESRKGEFRFTGKWRLGKQLCELRESIRRTGKDRVEYIASLHSKEALDTAALYLNVNLPLAFLKGRGIRIDNRRFRYSDSVSKKDRYAFRGVKRVVLELPEGELEITGDPFSLGFQDSRNFSAKDSKGPGNYSLHLHPRKTSGNSTSAEFRYTLTFRGIRSCPLRLEQAANRAFLDETADDGKGGWNDQGPQNDLRMFQPGRYRFFGVEFQVIDPAGNGGRSCIVLNGAGKRCFLDSAAIEVSGRGRWLYLLHANAFTGLYAKAGTLSVQFADGSSQEIPVRNRMDVGNWWGGIDWPNAQVVWKSANSSSVVGLYMTGFELRRDDPVKITFGKGEYPVWMIVAATLADRKAQLYRTDTSTYILPGEKWTPVKIQEVSPGSVLDFSRHADAPAGKYGHVIVKNGRFAFEKAPGKRIRFFGVNLCNSGDPFMTKDLAELFAKRMARAGYNTVRLHHFENSLTAKNATCSYEWDPEQLDRLDYLVFCLKKNGIYVTYDLYCSRKIRKGELPELGDFKAGVCFFESYRENWKEFTRRLMTHVNPYTGMRWADDPVFYCVNLVNENPLINTWNRGCEKAVLRQYGEWLRQKFLDSDENRKTRTGVFLRFLEEMQSRTIRWMTEFIRKDIGSNVLISDVNCGGSNGDNIYLMRSRNLLDVVDNHSYNDHPDHPNGGWSPPALFTQSSSISTLGRVFRRIMPTRIFGKPFLVTEYCFVHPNRFLAEQGPLTGACSSLQDWDGLVCFQYAWSHRIFRAETEYSSGSGYFDTLTNPVKRLSDYITWFLFLRGDVRPASRGAAIAMEALPWESRNVPDGFSVLGLVEQIGVLPTGTNMKNVRLVKGPFPAPSRRRYVSSTGEIILDTAPELKVITPKSECITTARSASEGKVLSFRNGGTFQTLSVHSLDNLPLERSSSLLLFHLADTKNTAEKFSAPDMTLLLEYGKGPMLLEIASSDVSLRLPSGEWKVSALNMSGTVKSSVKSAYREGVLRFPVSTRNAMVYLIEKKTE